ncbi:hypothetical protein J6590_074640 [Homalodisca vitripennis]|nr:hypothetical protein J6590_074640 [Homalodisca vitripennis]
MFLQAHNKAPDRQQSLWDATESPVVVEKRPRLPQKVVSCKKQAMYTVRDGKIVQLSAEHGSGVDKPASTAAEDSFSGQVFVALQPSVEKPQVCDRLTEEEIRKLPRFHNYKQGEVSKEISNYSLSVILVTSCVTRNVSEPQKNNPSRISSHKLVDSDTGYNCSGDLKLQSQRDPEPQKNNPSRISSHKLVDSDTGYNCSGDLKLQSQRDPGNSTDDNLCHVTITNILVPTIMPSNFRTLRDENTCKDSDVRPQGRAISRKHCVLPN